MVSKIVQYDKGRKKEQKNKKEGRKILPIHDRLTVENKAASWYYGIMSQPTSHDYITLKFNTDTSLHYPAFPF